MMEVWQRSRRRLGFVTLGCLLVFCKTGAIRLIIGTRSGLGAQKRAAQGTIGNQWHWSQFFCRLQVFCKSPQNALRIRCQWELSCQALAQRSARAHLLADWKGFLAAVCACLLRQGVLGRA